MLGKAVACALVLAVGVIPSTPTTRADVFNMPSGYKSLEMVPVGDAGNAADGSSHLGGVPYDYQIGKYEVTTAQYCEFLNAVAATDPYGLYSGYGINRNGTVGNYSYTVEPDRANRPVSFVSYWDACRFANWLQNGQPGLGNPVPQDAHSTEDGAYTMNGYRGSDGRSIARNASAVWCVPTQNEWYKAAYYKGYGLNAGYWDYPTQSDNIPMRELPPGRAEPPGSANYTNIVDSYLDPVHYTTEVGAYLLSPSAYGTFDQGGNVTEWNEAFRYSSLPDRTICGGSFEMHLNAGLTLIGGLSFASNPSTESSEIGFRITYVPEPGAMVMLFAGGLSLAFVAFRRL